MINLLPLEDKKILKAEEKWRLVLLLGILILSFFLCSILILYSVKIYVAGKAESQKFIIETTRNEFEKPETKELKDKISLANKNFLKLDNFYQGSLYLTDILEKIANKLSSGMYLTNVSYKKQTTEKEESFEIVLSGFAPNTDILFGFRKNLEEVFSIKIDVGDSWIKPTDFRFVFLITANQ